MQHVSRDNFRHLTGHGRELAGFIDRTLVHLNLGDDRILPGDLTIVHDEDTGHFDASFKDHPPPDGDPIYSMLIVAVQRNGVVEMTSLPLPLILFGAPDFSNLYVLYRHSFNGDESGDRIEHCRYWGITRRGWRTRWAEHLRAANAGSHYRFHQAIRRWYGTARVVNHMILACGLSEQQAMAMEEDKIAQETLYPLGLNMVPGGNAGLAYLRRIGAIGPRERVAPDDRQVIINRFFERASRKGLPNPLAAANWLNPNYAEKVICAGPDRLKPQQIRDARFFSSLGQDADTIAARIDARNVAQIQRLLSGATYSRVA